MDRLVGSKAALESLVWLIMADWRELQLLIVIAHRANNLWHRAASMRNVSCDELPKDHSKAVHISCLGVLLPSQDLWGHPVWSSHLSIIVPHKLFLISGKAKVTNLDSPVFCQKYILTLKVTVKNLLCMKVLNGEGHLLNDLEYLAVLQQNFAP